MTARVAFQGERGAYSEAASRVLAPHAEPLPCRLLGDVFDTVTAGRADLGVVPIENSHAGSINETYDLLLAHALRITGEHDQRIRHSLLALPGQPLVHLRRVFSHPQALAQCDAFLRAHRLEGVPAYDTAGSAKLIAEQHLTDAGAIAGAHAAAIYGLAVLAEGIETNPANYTKFLAIGREPAPHHRPAKTSVVFTTANVPGALHRVLGALASRSINMTKLESRPGRTVPWEYVFYVDVEGHADDGDVAAALEEVRALCTFLRVLGSYPRALPPG
jgi:prephenate dehydratase/chorismate mutase/prephenate dehydratase